MTKLRQLFAKPGKAILSSVCAAAILLTIDISSVYAAETIAESSAIGAENAQNFAFVDAGIDPVAAKVKRTKFDFKMGQFVYEIEFAVNGIKYEYWIKASNGTVLKKSVEIVTHEDTLQNKNPAHAPIQQMEKKPTANQATTPIVAKKIDLITAKQKALADAGLSNSDVRYTKAHLDYDDGIAVYDIEFYTATHEYEYEINATTGVVHECSIEAINIQLPKPNRENLGHQSSGEPNPNTGASTATTAYIGLDSAKSIAVGKAGLSISSVTFKKAKFDIDDGIPVYEIEFYYNGFEYDYEIDAFSGAILEYSRERDD